MIRDPAPSGQRVVFLIGNLGVGGVVRVLLNLVNHARLVSPVLAVRVAQGGLMPELDGRVDLYELSSGARAPVDHGIRSGETVAAVRRPPRGLSLSSVAEFWKECLALRRVLRASGAVSVSTFFMRGHLVALATRYLLAPGLGIVVNIHENMSERERADYPRWMERKLMRGLARYLLPRARLVVVPAKAIKDDLVSAYGVPPDKVQVLSNPVNLAEIRARAAEEVLDLPFSTDAGPLLVGIGRLIAWKGYHTAVEALAGLDGFPKARLFVLGAGPELEPLMQLAARLGIADRVFLPGAVSNPWKYLARADVLVHPSQSEAQALVFIEAMSLGVPIVSTSGSAGIRESLADGDCGLMVPFGDSRALANAVARVLSNADLRSRLTERGAARATAFDLPAAVERYERAITH